MRRGECVPPPHALVLGLVGDKQDEVWIPVSNVGVLYVPGSTDLQFGGRGFFVPAVRSSEEAEEIRTPSQTS